MFQTTIKKEKEEEEADAAGDEGEAGGRHCLEREEAEARARLAEKERELLELEELLRAETAARERAAKQAEVGRCDEESRGFRSPNLCSMGATEMPPPPGTGGSAAPGRGGCQDASQ